MKKKLGTDERFENAIKHQPWRYVVTRDKQGNLVQIEDRDSGFLHRKVDNVWHWIA